MYKINLHKIVLAAMATILVISSLAFAATVFITVSEDYKAENECIQAWIQMGVERKYIHRNNGDCFYSKTTNKWGN